MADKYISPTGSDVTGEGSPERPWQTLSFAWARTSVPDYIILKTGVYDYFTGFKMGNGTQKYVRSETNNSADVIIKPASLYSHGDTLQTFIGWSDSYSATDRLRLQGLTFIFDKTNISNWDASEGIAHSIFHPGCIRATSMATIVRVWNCYFLNLAEDISTHAFSANYTGNLEFYKNTFRNFTGNCIGPTALSKPITITLRDNIFSSCGSAVDDDAAGTTVNSNNNCYFNNVVNLTSGAALGANDITSDPQFKTADSMEFTTESPCIDAGIVVEGYVDTYSGDAPDIGCYEQTTVAVPDLTGMTQSEAIAALTEGLLVRGKFTGIFLNTELPNPIVKSSTPAAGVKVPVQSAVDIMFNLGTRNGLTYVFEVY